jgi:glucose-6-phosphate 1-dehydrogenase
MSAALDSDAFVFFGATGDLARKKIFPALYSMVHRGGLDIPIIGMARAGWTLEKLRLRARESVEHSADFEAGCFEKLAAQLRYVDGDYTDPQTFIKLKQALGLATRPIHYLAIPPSMFGSVVRGLEKSGCADNARVIVEKPFGRDLATAQALDRTLHEVFPESAIFRIDHYLGKEAVQNLLYFRFARSRRHPRRRAKPPAAGHRAARDGPPHRPRARGHESGKTALVPRDATARPKGSRSRSIQRLSG